MENSSPTTSSFFRNRFVQVIMISGILLQNGKIGFVKGKFTFFNGLFMPCIHIGINTLILQFTEQEFVGRVNGAINPLFMGAMVITMSLAGWLKIQFSLVIMYMVSGTLFFLGMILASKLFDKENKLIADGEQV